MGRNTDKNNHKDTQIICKDYKKFVHPKFLNDDNPCRLRAVRTEPGINVRRHITDTSRTHHEQITDVKGKNPRKLYV